MNGFLGNDSHVSVAIHALAVPKLHHAPGADRVPLLQLGARPVLLTQSPKRFWTRKIRLSSIHLDAAHGKKLGRQCHTLRRATMRQTYSGPVAIPVDEIGDVARSLSFAEATPAVAKIESALPSLSPIAARPERPELAANDALDVKEPLVPESAPIQVVLRVRPLSAAERAENNEMCVSPQRKGGIVRVRLMDPAKHPAAIRKAGRAVFRFGDVFDPSSTQEDLFARTTLPLVSGLFQQRSAVVFAYGQTCSGKTWTIQGSRQSPGLLPRSLDVILSSIASAKGMSAHRDSTISEQVARLVNTGVKIEPERAGVARQTRQRTKPSQERTIDTTILPVRGDVDYSIVASYLEIYNEQCYDLFVPSSGTKSDEARTAGESGATDGADSKCGRNQPRFAKPTRQALRLKGDGHGELHGVGQTEVGVQSVADVDRLLEFGQRNRSVAHTQANEHSSRSHAIFIITLKQVETVPQARGPPKVFASSAKLSIVDLAGSERTSRTSNSGQRLKESAKINTSLMNLGRCLQVMRQNQKIASSKEPERVKQIVPFRRSKLTMLLQHSLESGAAVMIANVSPAMRDADDTIQALRCAALAKEVKMVAGTRRRALVDTTNLQCRGTALAPGGTCAEADKVQSRTRSQAASRKPRTRTVQKADTEYAVAAYEKKLADSTRRIGALMREIELLRMEHDEEQISRKEADKERDELFRQNEMLRLRLADTEGRLGVLEVEIREEVALETEKMLEDLQQQHEVELTKLRRADQELVERRISIVTKTTRKEMAQRVANRASVAFHGMQINFDSEDEGCKLPEPTEVDDLEVDDEDYYYESE